MKKDLNYDIMPSIPNENDLKNLHWRAHKETLGNGTTDFFADNFKITDTINSDLTNMDKWFLDNNMKRNHSKYQAMIMWNKRVSPKFLWNSLGISSFQTATR